MTDLHIQQELGEKYLYTFQNIDKPYMEYISGIISYIINPQNKVPPKQIIENNGLVFCSNLYDYGLSKDISSKKMDFEKVFNCYQLIQECFASKFDPNNNLTYYPINLIKSSDSSKLIHGLPYREIFGENKQKYIDNTKELKELIDSYRKKLSINEDIEIISARIIGEKVLVRLKKKDFYDVTMLIGYPNKEEIRHDEYGNEIIMSDVSGNLFSPEGIEEIKYNFNQNEIKELANNAHNNGALFMMNFYAWRAPESVTEENYKNYYNEVIHENNSPENYEEKDDNIKNIWVLHRFDSGKLVRIKLVGGENELWETQDQIMPDYGYYNGNKEEKEKFNYWLGIYKKNVHNLMDFGVDIFRIDLAHGFGKGDDFTLFKSIITDAYEYAKIKDKKIFFVLETYNPFYKEKFLNWNKDFDYSIIKIYHTAIERNLSNIHYNGGTENFINDLKEILQNINESNGKMLVAASFDDFPLVQTLENSGMEHKYILEFLILLGKIGYNIFIYDRDFLGHKGEIYPIVGGNPKGNEGEYNTHTHSKNEELDKKIKNTQKDIFADSEGIKILEEMKKQKNIIGLTIEGNKVIFIFENGDKRIFDFDILKNGGLPETIKIELSQEDVQYLNGLDELMKKINSNLLEDNIPKTDLIKQKLPNINNYEFWKKFSDYIKIKSGIEDWDRFKIETYFQFNRYELIKGFITEQIPLTESEDIKSELENIMKQILLEETEEENISEETKEIRLELKNTVKKILLNKGYGDLTNLM